MTQTEIAVLQHENALAKQYQAENAQLRSELERIHRSNQQMSAEDAQVIALVNAHNRSKPRLATVAPPSRPPFDFDTAEIEPIDAPFVQIQPSVARASYLVRFAGLVVLESLIWLAHHFGWFDLVLTLCLSVIVFLFANLRLAG